MTLCEQRGWHRRVGNGNGCIVVMSSYCTDCGVRLWDNDPPSDAAHDAEDFGGSPNRERGAS